MATVEKSGVIKYKDSNGDTTVFYPNTLKDNVSGMGEIDVHVAGSKPIDMASTDGAAYTCIVPGITSLIAGASFIGVPAIVSTSNAVTLNVNDLGAKLLRRRVSTSSSTTTTGYNNAWLTAGKPLRIMYDGLFWVVDMVRPYADDLMGIVPIANGGTGNDTGYVTAGKSASSTLGSHATAEGHSTTASGDSSHAEGEQTTASGNYSHAEGESSVASGIASHAEGGAAGDSIETMTPTTASGDYSHAEGQGTKASGLASHAEGNSTTASGASSHAEGISTAALANGSHSEGNTTTVNGAYSHAEGFHTVANGFYAHAEGYYTTTGAGYAQHVSGKYNKDAAAPSSPTDTQGSLFVVGNGTSESAKSNAFRITASGACMGTQSFTASGADYAEYFEWVDGNPNSEDRRGHFVTLDGDKIRIANDSDDYILGVVSSRPSVIGDGFTDQWQGMYLTDVFGENINETVEVPEYADEETGEVIPAHTEIRFVLNPEYDYTKNYIGRELRKEWTPVGLVGKLVIVDDGTCEVDGYCKVTASGGATKSTEKTPYRVMSRLDDTHIKVFIK